MYIGGQNFNVVNYHWWKYFNMYLWLFGRFYKQLEATLNLLSVDNKARKYFLIRNVLCCKIIFFWPWSFPRSREFSIINKTVTGKNFWTSLFVKEIWWHYRWIWSFCVKIRTSWGRRGKWVTKFGIFRYLDN